MLKAAQAGDDGIEEVEQNQSGVLVVVEFSVAGPVATQIFCGQNAKFLVDQRL